MGKDYSNLTKELFEQIDDFRNSLIICDFHQ